MDKLKCECGHVNPDGTILCESCGKPVEENQHKDGNDQSKLLNMRYDGTARRSQTYNRSIIDKIWNFFSSVKNGVILIVIALIISALGTLLPQEEFIPAESSNRDPAVFYEKSYGTPGKIYYQLGLHEMYSSWWYMILLALIGVSLVICSLDRFLPLYRALNMQQPKRHDTFLKRQRLFSKTENINDEDLTTFMERLKKQRYSVLEKDNNMLAEKNRFSRWGPYVNHIGLIIILIAALLRSTPLFFLDDYVWVREGEQIIIPSTNGKYYIENKEFHLEYYDQEDERFKEALKNSDQLVAKNYQTDVIIYENKNDEPSELTEVMRDSIRMNKPLKFGGFTGYTLYQSGFQENEFTNMTFKLTEIENSDSSLGELTIDLASPEKSYSLNNEITVEISEYYPEYELVDGEPRSVSKFPKNPAFIFKVHHPKTNKSEFSFVGIGKNLDASGNNKYKLEITDFETHYVSGLTVRRDYTLPIFILGAAIFMIGVVQGMYWQHRRIWIKPNNHGIIIAAHTNKNWFGFKKEINTAINGTGIQKVIDQGKDEV